MSKKTRLVPERTVTKRQLTRWQRETRLQKIILVSAAVVLVLVIGIPLFGYYREIYAKGQETVLKVNGKAFNADYYVKRVYFGLYLLDLQDASTPSQQTDPWTNARTSLPLQMLDTLTQEELIRQGAQKLGITATPEEITKSMQDRILPPVGPDEKVDQVKRDADFQAALKGILQKGRLSEPEFRAMVEVDVLRDKIDEHLKSQVTSPAEQVHARGILFTTADEAKAARDKIAGGADFAAVADEEAKKNTPEPTPTPQPSPTPSAQPGEPTPTPQTGAPTATPQAGQPNPSGADQQQPQQPVLNGGDLGWFPRGTHSWEFDQAVFKMKPGDLSDPISTPEGYWLVKVEEHADAKDIDETTLTTVKNNALQYWLEQQQGSSQIERYFDSGKYSWVMDQVNQMRKRYLGATSSQLP